MTEPIYKDGWLTVFQGDNRVVLGTLPEQSVHCVVTSPPYFGLRDYGTATWDGGEADCDHQHDTAHQKQGATSQRAGRSNVEQQRNENFRNECGKCGAQRMDAQIGLESSPAEYVAAMVEVFRGIRRVLRDDGTVWLNLGDSYASSSTGSLGDKMTFDGGQGNQAAGLSRPSKLGFGLAAKQLIGIPWRVAFALQDDGWFLRSDVIWSKPNGMPSSVTDRPTLSHEYMFLLTKRPTYFYDADAIREPHQPITLERIKYGLNQTHPDGQGIAVPPIKTTQIDGADDFDTAVVTKGVMGDRFANPLGRNKRTVWEVATVPYPNAHYAVFPPKLIEPCIKAGSSERGVCAECGAPWVRVVEVESVPSPGRELRPQVVPGQKYAQQSGNFWTPPTRTELGWERTCAHEAGTVPATVLDPFAGSGTVGKVSQGLSRRAVLIDLSAEYLTQQFERNAQVPLGL